ncbi:MAG: TnsA endonuclease N-terminal domain-containing protein [Candidatus Dormibacteria bacterium]
MEWASEEMCLPYRDPARNNSIHRYFPDYVIKVCKPDGTFQTTMIEIKPKKQTIKPVQPKKVTKQFLRDVVTYATNEAKWNVAKEYCADHKWEFQLITEDDLQIKT